MKILHVITSLRTGGAEHLLVDLLPRLKAHGHEVGVLLFDGTPTPFSRQLQEAGIAVTALGHGPKAMHNPWLVFALHRAIRGYDVVHAHNTPCQLLLAAASYGTRCRLMTTEHNTHNRRRGKWQWQWVDRWMYSRYETVVCCSRETETALRHSLAVGADSMRPRIVTISNGVDTRRFAEVQPACGLHADGTVLVMMVAAFRPQKYQEMLVEAISMLPPRFRLALVGDGVRREEVEAVARRLGVAQRVAFLGIRQDIPQLLRTADILALATHHEGLSLSSLEAMASGRPFVGSDVEGLRDIVAGAGLLVPNTPQAFADAFSRLDADAALRQRVADACQHRAAQYDIMKTVQGYEQVLEPKK